MDFRGRQIATLTVVAAAVAVATSLVSATLLARTIVDDAREGAELLARALYHQASRIMRQHPLDELRQALATDEGLRSYSEAVIGYSPTVQYLAISDASGVVIFHSDPTRRGSQQGPTISLESFAGRTPLDQLWALSRARGPLVVDLPFSVEGNAPFGTVHVAVSTVLLKRELVSKVALGALLASGVVLVAFALSFLVANRLLAPIRVLRAQLARIDIGTDQPPLDFSTEADVGRIAEFFDSLSRRLDADQRLGESGLSLKTLITNLNDAVIVLGPDRTILSLNDAARRIFEPKTATSGRTLDELLDRTHPVREVIEEALERGRAESIRSVPMAGNGESISFLLSAKRLSQAERTRGVIATARDLQRLSRLASQLSYAQKLASLGRLTSGVAHELRNPLNAMTMHLVILRKKIAAGSAEAVRHVDVLEEELRRLDRVVKGFLEFSRPEEIELEQLEIDSVLRGAIGRVRPLTEEKGVALELEVQPPLPTIVANSHLLEQAFVNLLKNSYEATPPGGRIEVTASRGETGVDIVIGDTGVGIPNDLLPKIFNLYFTTKEAGSGVGLSLVYRVVQLHGGEVAVDSEPGQGTRVKITLQEGAL